MKTRKIRSRNPDRTALLICCTREEAARIRSAAIRERRTVSGFVMNAVMNRFALEGRIQEKRQQLHLATQAALLRGQEGSSTR